MISRGTLLAALLGIELAIVGEAVVAIRGGGPAAPSTFRADDQTASGSRLVEGGPHKVFHAGAQPALTVDIGYADLTIVATKDAQIDVSVSPSNAYGFLRASAPITAGNDGRTVRIAAAAEHRWSIGDDRRVTVLVPPETRVTVVNAGDIDVTGLRAEASINSIGRGSITVNDYAAPALHVASADGRIALHQIVTARLAATGSNGRVEGSALHVHDGSIQSNGRVTLGLAPGSDTLLTAETSDGRVRVSGFPAAASTAATPKSGADDDSDDASSQTIRVGAGTGRLDVHSSDGNITITQEG